MPTNRFSLGFLRRLTANPLAAIEEASRSDSPFSLIAAGPFRCFVLTDPDVAAKLLSGSADTFRRTPDLAFWFPPAGEGVASSPHEKWLRQRKLLAPFFKAGSDERLLRITSEETERLVGVLAGRVGEEVDVQELVMETTLRIAVRHLLVDPFPGDSSPISEAIQTAMHHAAPGKAIVYRILRPFNKPMAQRYLHGGAKREALDLLDGFVDEVLELAARDDSVRSPLLQALLDADAAGELDAGELRDQAATFLVAAVDSVGSAVTWTLWHLARSPSAAELAASSPEGALACAQESMRLVPPLWIYWREILQTHEIGGVTLRPNDLVVFVPYVVHMRAERWQEPGAFKPERFLGDEGAARARGFAYMPFGHGAHACLGRRMAFLEAKTIVHALAGRFSMSLGAGVSRSERPVEVRVAVLVKDGLRLRIRDRA